MEPQRGFQESLGRRFPFSRSLRINKSKRARKGLEKSQRRRSGRKGRMRYKGRKRAKLRREGEEWAVGS